MSKNPVRLGKVDKNDFSILNKLMAIVEAWILNHATLCLFVLLALLMALFVTLMFAICGVSAVESGTQYRMEAWI